MELVERFKDGLVQKMFNFFSPLAHSMGMLEYQVKLFHVYISFLSFGSVRFFSLSIEFIRHIGRYMRNKKRNPIYDF